MGLYLDSKFYSVGLHVSPYAGIRVLIIVSFKAVSLRWVSLPTFSFSILFWLLGSLAIPCEFEGQIFLFCKRKAIRVLVGLLIPDHFG